MALAQGVFAMIDQSEDQWFQPTPCNQQAKGSYVQDTLTKVKH